MGVVAPRYSNSELYENIPPRKEADEVQQEQQVEQTYSNCELYESISSKKEVASPPLSAVDAWKTGYGDAPASDGGGDMAGVVPNPAHTEPDFESEYRGAVEIDST